MGAKIYVSDLITALAALFAVIVSLLSYFHAKRKTTTDRITANRMEWIKEVRNHCMEFLIEYSKETPSVFKLKELVIKIQLFGYGDIYSDLFRSLNKSVALLESGDGKRNT